MTRVKQILRDHTRRFTWFSIIGALVFLLGEAILFVGVSWGMSTFWAFLLQAFVSVEVSFVANWKYVFRRDVSFRASLWAPFRQANPTDSKWRLLRASDAWKSFWKFNFSRGICIPLDQILFIGLVWMGMQYLLANVVETAIFTVVNYLVSWLWTFRKGGKKRKTVNLPYQPRHLRLPRVAVVIPVKGSQRTLGACVDSLLRQDHPASEVILVGDVDDESWTAVRDHISAGRVTALETVVNSVGRDANAKRNIGLDYARQQGHRVLALTDSDMVLPQGWLRLGADHIRQGWQCVAGPMHSISTGFWPTYVDRNPLLPKTPRMQEDYVLMAGNFGKKKPPITANAFFTVEAFDKTGGLDVNFVRDYEDYPFFARMVTEGIDILCTGRLIAGHNHRAGFRALTRDYMSSGWGCADFVAFCSESRMAGQRLRETRMIQILSILGPLTLAALLFSPYALAALVATTATYGMLGSYSAVKARSLKGFAFPFVTGVFLAAFLRGFAKGRAFNKVNDLNTTIEAVWPLQIAQ